MDRKASFENYVPPKPSDSRSSISEKAEWDIFNDGGKLRKGVADSEKAVVVNKDHQKAGIQWDEVVRVRYIAEKPESSCAFVGTDTTPLMTSEDSPVKKKAGLSTSALKARRQNSNTLGGYPADDVEENQQRLKKEKRKAAQQAKQEQREQVQKALPRGLVDVLTRHREESFGLWCGRSTAIVGRVEELFLDVGFTGDELDVLHRGTSKFPAYLEVRELVRAVVETHKNELIKAARDRKKKSYIDAFCMLWRWARKDSAADVSWVTATAPTCKGASGSTDSTKIKHRRDETAKCAVKKAKRG